MDLSFHRFRIWTSDPNILSLLSFKIDQRFTSMLTKCLLQSLNYLRQDQDWPRQRVSHRNRDDANSLKFPVGLRWKDRLSMSRGLKNIRPNCNKSWSRYSIRKIEGTVNYYLWTGKFIILERLRTFLRCARGYSTGGYGHWKEFGTREQLTFAKKST